MGSGGISIRPFNYVLSLTDGLLICNINIIELKPPKVGETFQLPIAFSRGLPNYIN